MAQQNISIYYNEGSDALDTGNELTQINGYFISSNMLQNDINGVLDKIERLPAGTPVMIDMKVPTARSSIPLIWTAQCIPPPQTWTPSRRWWTP